MTKELPRQVKGKKKRIGRGYGSGLGGHTVGRGQKGQKARNKVGILFEGLKVKKSFIKRLPLRRGKGKLKAKDKPIIVKISLLNLLPSGAKVDVGTLAKHGIVVKEDAAKFGVKILGNGDLKKRLTVALPISKSAAKKIEKAGGKLVEDKLKAPRKAIKRGRQSAKRKAKVKGQKQKVS